MCNRCFDEVRDIFPNVPEKEINDFLFGTTCFPFGDPQDIQLQLLNNKTKMKTDDYKECYVIADMEMAQALMPCE